MLNTERMDLSEKIYSLPKRKIKLCTLNPHIVCLLCAGYLVDATTILECLHTFCKSCIVRYLQSSKLCPTCGTVVHETDPLSYIKLDRTMQDIMNKILPDLSAIEKKNEDEFLKSMQKKESQKEDSKPTVASKIHQIDSVSWNKSVEHFNLCLELDKNGQMWLDETEVVEIRNKHIRCPGRVKILHLKKLVSRFYEPYCDDFEIKFKCDDIELGDDEHLKFIYVVRWKRKSQPIILYYGFKKRDCDNDMIIDDCISTIEPSEENTQGDINSIHGTNLNHIIKSAEGDNNCFPSSDKSLTDFRECKHDDISSADTLSTPSLSETKNQLDKSKKLSDVTNNPLIEVSNYHISSNTANNNNQSICALDNFDNKLDRQDKVNNPNIIVDSDTADLLSSHSHLGDLTDDLLNINKKSSKDSDNLNLGSSSKMVVKSVEFKSFNGGMVNNNLFYSPQIMLV